MFFLSCKALHDVLQCVRLRPLTRLLGDEVIREESAVRLTKGTDYGTRGVVRLAKMSDRGVVLVSDIATAEGLPESYLAKIFQDLAKEGIVRSHRGAKGGFSLGRPAGEITLRQIIEVFEGKCLVDCLKNPASCPRVYRCASRDVWALLEGKIFETLESINLEQMVEAHRRKTEENVMNNI